jgi:DUF1680 family protein
MENHGKYGELIYSYSNTDLFVNLFIASRLNWTEQGFTLSQHTSFPDEETSQLIVEAAKGNDFTINVRYPGWVEPGKLKVTINGKDAEIKTQPDNYIALRRQWKKGDQITIRLPMRITAEELPDGSNYFAFLNGPIVLAAKTDTTDLDNLRADANQFGGYRARGRMYSLDSMPVLLSNKANLAEFVKPLPGKKQTFIAPSLISPFQYSTLELIPFYKLHDARYMIYWKKRSS